MENKFRIKKYLSAFQIIVLGFGALILLGTLLLMLPISARNHTVTPFADALFTSTSAVCVTGLVVKDTATYWSPFGQAIILSLIQIGGLGIVSVAALITIASGKKIGLMQRNTIQEATSSQSVGGVVKHTSFILKVTLIVELLGAILLAPVFCRDFGLKGIWMSLFHSVSAFCNAGFDLMGERGQFSSLTSYATDIQVNVVIMLLIILGGIGFFVWHDVVTNKFHFKRYSLQSKVVLICSLILIVFPAILFFLFEFDAFNLKDRILLSLFQSVTTRTAGFNTGDFSAFSDSGKVISVMLMLVGGSPGSTAGGMKTTTLAVLLATVISVFKRKEETVMFKRRIANEIIAQAAAIFLLYITIAFTGAMLISKIDGIPFLTTLFETGSAIGTVGLSFGITPTLSLASRALLIVMMYWGRVGGLTLIFATVVKTNTYNAKLPQERLTVG